MQKIKVSRAILADKLYIHKDDLLESSFDEIIATYFTYKIVDEKPFINAYFDNDTGVFSCPIGGYRRFDIKEIIDQRPRLTRLDSTTDIVLFPEQQEVADKFLQGDKLFSGLIQAPCSFGKSYLGAWLAVKYDKPAVIVVDTKLLAYQWLEVLQRHTNQQIGFIGDNKFDPKPITVAIYKTLLNNIDKVKNMWEFAIIDEAHSCVAETFSQAVNNLNTRVNIALTATPWRKDSLHLALPDYFGPNIIHAKDRGQLPVKVFIKPIPIRFSVFNPKKEWASELTKLCDNEKYLDIIQKDIKQFINDGRCPLVLSERLELLDKLSTPRIPLLVGKTMQEQRDYILLNIGKKFDAVLSTKIFDKGISAHRLDTLILTCPSNNHYLLEQRLGRIRREHDDKSSPLLLDYFLEGGIVKNQQNSRLIWYQEQGFDIEYV